MASVAGQFSLFAKRSGLQRYKLTDGTPFGEALAKLCDDVFDPLGEMKQTFREAPLGWLKLPAGGSHVDECRAAAQRLAESCDELVVCGIGGSVLGTQAIYDALNFPGSGLKQLHFLDNIDPAQAVRLSQRINPARTALCIVTKSGGTLETFAGFSLLLSHLEGAGICGDTLASRVAVITGTHPSSLRELAKQNNWALLSVPADVGGRFSLLSAVGLLPLAFAGVDIDALLSGAKRMQGDAQSQSGADNLAYRLAAAHWLLQTRGGLTQCVQYAYGDPLASLAAWWRQLWAESLGKSAGLDGRGAASGMSPSVARGATDQHSQNQLYMDGPPDKLYMLLSVERWPYDPQLGLPAALAGMEGFRSLEGRRLGELLGASAMGTRDALMERERPLIELVFHELTPAALGAYAQFWMLTTAFAGLLYNINAFDQPGVELSKKLTRKRL